jgi:hypothetical protein
MLLGIQSTRYGFFESARIRFALSELFAAARPPSRADGFLSLAALFRARLKLRAREDSIEFGVR